MSFPYIAALAWETTTTEYIKTSSFPVGQLGMTEDGSLWRLCKAGADMTLHQRAKINYYTTLDGVSGTAPQAPLASAIVAGDTDFTITDATNAFAADYYKGGYVIQPRSTGDNTNHIWKSDAEVSNTYKIYVSAPFSLADAEGNTVQCFPSPWGDVRQAEAYKPTYEHFVCCINIGAITSEYYFWGLVRGPHWFGVGASGVWPGAAANDRDVYFHQDGTIEMADVSLHTAQISRQRAGYLMFSGDYGDALIYVQIE